MSEPTTALIPTNGEVLPATQPTMIRPLATPDEAYEAFQAFQELKKRLITEDDRITKDGRPYVKKSGWRKIAAAFGISTECVAEEREDLQPTGFLWRVRVRATAPNGRYAEGTAGCASNERRFSHVEHDVYAQAFTRACNRAISDLVGGGEVSAEEMKAEAPAPPPISREQAEAVTEKFLASMHIELSEAPAETGPYWKDIIAALVVTRGDLRRAWKILHPHQFEGEAVEEAADDD